MAKRILMSLLTIAIVASFVGVSTLALYTDTASSQGNLFQAGIMDLKVDGSDNMFTVDMHAAPGNDGWNNAWRAELVTSEGTIAGGALSFKIDGVEDFPGETPGPEAAIQDPDVGDLSSLAVVRLIGYEPGYPPYDLSHTVFDQYYTMAELQAGVVLTGAFQNGMVFELDYYLPASAGNAVMGDYCTFNAHLTLEQAH